MLIPLSCLTTPHPNVLENNLVTYNYLYNYISECLVGYIPHHTHTHTTRNTRPKDN